MANYNDGLNAVASALASPGRRQVVDRLRAGPASTSALAHLLDLGLPGVTKHLQVLAAAGLTQQRKAGRVMTHHLIADPLLGYSDWLASRAAFWQRQLDDLAAEFGR
jgi:DNA-binding transcriptional ArsR family regulator